MKVEFTVSTPKETRTYIREYQPSTPEYVISDDAFLAAVSYINSHNIETLDDVNVDYKEVT